MQSCIAALNTWQPEEITYRVHGTGAFAKACVHACRTHERMRIKETGNKQASRKPYKETHTINESIKETNEAKNQRINEQINQPINQPIDQQPHQQFQPVKSTNPSPKCM